MNRHYCTYFDRNYLSRAVALIESLNQHETEPFCLYAVCLDELSRTLLQRLELPNVVLVPVHEIEYRDARLLAAKQNRTAVEYYWTLTPAIILWLLEEHPEIEVLTYLDSDLYFFSSPEPLFAELADQSILIHEHRYSPTLKHLEPTSGTYNVGLLCFRNDAHGLAVLRWWRDRCIEWCYNRYEDGKFGDQLYLNGWPESFERVVVLKNVGAGVAPWNHAQYQVAETASGGVTIDGVPLVFYHFHALAMLGPEALVPAKHTHYPLTIDLLRSCFTRYGDALATALNRLRSVLPDFSFGLALLDKEAHRQTIMVRSEPELAAQLGQSHPMRQLGDAWLCFFSPQVQEYAAMLDALETLRDSADPAIALERVVAHVQEWGETPDLLNMKAEIAFNSGQQALAEDMLHAVIQRNRRHGRAYNNLAVLRWEEGRQQEALQLIRESSDLQPHDRDTVINLGAMLSAVGEVAEAHRRYLDYLRANPGDDIVYKLFLELEAAR